jgi:hypothetical protein
MSRPPRDHASFDHQRVVRHLRGGQGIRRSIREKTLGAAFVAPFATGRVMNQSFSFFFSVSGRRNRRIAKSTEVCGNPSCAKNAQGWVTRKRPRDGHARVGTECLDEFASLKRSGVLRLALGRMRSSALAQDDDGYKNGRVAKTSGGAYAQKARRSVETHPAQRTRKDGAPNARESREMDTQELKASSRISLTWTYSPLRLRFIPGVTSSLPASHSFSGGGLYGSSLARFSPDNLLSRFHRNYRRGVFQQEARQSVDDLGLITTAR